MAERHVFVPVKSHLDDDECTYRADGTDATYCGRPESEHPQCTCAPNERSCDSEDCAGDGTAEDDRFSDGRQQRKAPGRPD